jgi:hypothetical protein
MPADREFGPHLLPSVVLDRVRIEYRQFSRWVDAGTGKLACAPRIRSDEGSEQRQLWFNAAPG